MKCKCIECYQNFNCEITLFEWDPVFSDYCYNCYDDKMYEIYDDYCYFYNLKNNNKRYNKKNKKRDHKSLHNNLTASNNIDNNTSSNNTSSNSSNNTSSNNIDNNTSSNSSNNTSSNNIDNNTNSSKKSKILTKEEIEAQLERDLDRYFLGANSNDSNKDKDKDNDSKSKKNTKSKSRITDENKPKLNYVRMDLSEFFNLIANEIKTSENLDDSSNNKRNGNMEVSPDVSNYDFEWIGNEVKNIKDLIHLGETYDPEKKIQTNIDLWRLNKCVPALKELDAMIGMEKVKDSIFYQIIFHLQKLDNENKDMHHTVIKGPPGVGKTQLTHIIAKIYKALGFLKTDKVISVKRDDLVAGYVGQTAIKTKKKLEEALGGVLLIDEAYAFGQGDGKDSFSKEAIDLLTSYLSEHGNEFICIIAGYKEALEERFFTLNEGLKRRFNIHYEIDGYKPIECMKIYEKLVRDNEWNYIGEETKTDKFFNKNEDAFPHFGGDMLTLFSFCKKAHSQRLLKIKTLNELNSSRKNINYEDLEKGYELFLINKCEDDASKNNKTPIWMYS